MQFQIGKFRIGRTTFNTPTLRYIHHDGTIEPIIASTNILLLLDVSKYLSIDTTIDKKKDKIKNAIAKAISKLR